MSSALLLAFAGDVIVLCLIPGPNLALIVANRFAPGARYGLATVAGAASALALQLVAIRGRFRACLIVKARLRNKVTGARLCAAGAGLALARGA